MVEVSEEGQLATQAANTHYTLTTTGEALTGGRHFWEVEIAGDQLVGTFVGVCKSGADPRADHRQRGDTTAWLMSSLQGTLWGNGKHNSDRAGGFNQGDRM